MRRSPVLAALAAVGLTLGIGTATSFSGSSLVGARWVYAVTAKDATGTTLGTSTLDVNCC